MSEWARAFESLLAALRAGSCPYFYYVSTDFHALFRTEGDGMGRGSNGPPLCALVSHSTEGLRESLRNRGVGFATPYCAGRGGPPSGEQLG